MALEEATFGGYFQLLDFDNDIYSVDSYSIKEFAFLPNQVLIQGEKLVAPSAFFNDSYNQVLFSGGIYSLKMHNGDLLLYSNFGAGEKKYWSLHQTLYKGDLSHVLYAGIAPDEGGLALFTSDGSVAYTTGPLRLIGREFNPQDTYVSVDADGNLRSYYLVKGEFWSIDFEALPANSDLPSYCRAYGVCSCPASFTPNNRKDLTQGCKPESGPITKCAAKNQRFVHLTGYDYIYNQYATPLHVSVKDCNSKCLSDCSCLAYFYYQKSGLCYLTNEVRTLKKVSDNNKLAFIKL